MMITRKCLYVSIAVTFAITTSVSALAQTARLSDEIIGKAGKPKLAVPDFRGTGRTAALMAAFNSTLFSDLQSSGVVDMISKSYYPLQVPQQPSDIRPQTPNAPPAQRGLAMPDWSAQDVGASHLAIGYAAEVNGIFVLQGFLLDLHVPTVQGATVALGGGRGRYTESMDENGARKAAHEFANDIVVYFGGGSLTGSHIYFVSDRTGNKEIWVMDFDGGNPRQLTHSRSINITPGISPDGTLLAYTSYRTGRPQIDVIETGTGRMRQFLNPSASVNSSPEFSPDGRFMYFASTFGGGAEQIFRSSINGGGLSAVGHSPAIETEPKVNPKNPSQIVFVSGRSGPQQVYRMNSEGLDVERITNGEGEASNPSWHPDGQHILFSWTRGYAKGDWNVFLMDVASRRFDQLTHSEGRNENPVWAPDGRHLVFMSTRDGRKQIWTMLADGTEVKRLTNQGNNTQPVWGK
jgi:TolB protein